MIDTMTADATSLPSPYDDIIQVFSSLPSTPKFSFAPSTI